MGVRQLASGRWQARVMIDHVRRVETLDDERAARDWLVVTQAQSITGALPGTATLDAYVPRWLATYRDGPASTHKFHENNARLYVRPALGPKRLANVLPSDIARMLNAIASAVSVAKADSVYRTTSALFGAAEADGIISRSPVRSKRHRPKRQPEPHVVLERPQARAMLERLEGWQRDAAILQLSLGARYGEIAGLTPADVDLGAGRVTIRRRWSTNRTVAATKNQRLRTLELPALARATVERLVEDHPGAAPVPDLGGREHDGSDWNWRWLILTETGRPPNLGHYNRAIKAACRAVDAPEVSSHGLRHTYVSWMIDDGHSADTVAMWIGDHPVTVQRVYSHMLDASSVPAAASIDAALG